MVDLVSQYHQIKKEIDQAISTEIEQGHFINGKSVQDFENAFGKYLEIENVISCGNGTDALLVALMALELNTGDEIILPAFTYAATAEVIGLLNLVPVMVDVDLNTFNSTAALIRDAITDKTKVIIPVHLFGQCTDMEAILTLASENSISIIEDNAQSIGSTIEFSNGKINHAGTIGDISTTSFYPSKNLGCYGDGGAVMTNNSSLAKRIKMICNHGQSKKYHHSIIGVNSRLDSIQAAVLNVKLKELDKYITSRNAIADKYDLDLKNIEEIQIPARQSHISHSFHQYTLRIKNQKRDALKNYLQEKGIPSMVYYPIPLYRQDAYKDLNPKQESLPNTEILCKEVLSLPIHTEMNAETQKYIIETIKTFFS